MAAANDAGRWLSRDAGEPPQTMSAGEGVTYWADHEKATRELGFEPRSFERAIADTLGRR